MQIQNKQIRIYFGSLFTWKLQTGGRN